MFLRARQLLLVLVSRLLGRKEGINPSLAAGRAPRAVTELHPAQLFWGMAQHPRALHKGGLALESPVACLCSCCWGSSALLSLAVLSAKAALGEDFAPRAAIQQRSSSKCGAATLGKGSADSHCLPALLSISPRAKMKCPRSPSSLCHISPLSALTLKAKPPSLPPRDLHERSQWGVLFIHAGLILLNYKVCQMRI